MTTDPRPHPGGLTELGDRTVARVGLGVMQLGERSGDHGDAVALLRRAVDLGVDHLDTAEFYGAGSVNRLLHDALGPRLGELAVVTKVGAEHDGAGLVPAQRPEQLRDQVEANLRSLGVDRLTVVNLRRMDARPGLVATGDQVVDLESQLAVLVALREEGKIGGLGLSHVDVDQLRTALPAGVVCVQNAASLLDHSSAAVHAVCREEGLAWVPFFPLGSAFPGLPKVSEHPDVRAVAERSGATPAQVGLAWLLADDERTLLIPGTTNRHHLEQNLAAGEVVLDDDARRVLGALAG